METFDQSLRRVLLSLLSPDNNTRREAERYVTSCESQSGFTLALLNLVNVLSNSVIPEDIAIRQSASVLFKNVIKRRWQTEEDDKENAIPDGDREAIKLHLINLMCSTPVDVQKQLAEAVSIIAKHDFPAKWDTLIGQLIQKIESKDIHIIKGVMLTANSIMKRFRYVFKNDQLYAELDYCLKQFQQPLLLTYQYFGNLVILHANDKASLLIIMETLALMTRIYFSLNWQDIPEFFEDHINDWMTEFAKYLTYSNPILIDNDEETEPGPIDKLQAAIVDNLVLYATKYEEEFASHLSHFTQIIWELLLHVSIKPKYDNLATNSIKFLTSVSSKQMNMHLFNDNILQQIIEHIVIRNLASTENDEDIFESNPTDYIQKDIEGSDQDTRRRAACELIRSLLKFFNIQISQLCITYINLMLTEYNKRLSWKCKDTALNLILAVAVLSTSTGQGAAELNPNVNILEMFNTHILPEIHDTNINARPIVKADAIKLVCLFRTHVNTSFMLDLIPHMVRYLKSEYVVVQTYAAMCIERFLSVKDRDATGKMVHRVTRDSIAPHLNELFSGLFIVMANPDLPENDYVMKCVMRVLVLMDYAIAPVMELVLQQLTASLERVCKNPANPHFNHYLFECLAVLVRSSCNGAVTGTPTTIDPILASARMEALLFPPFQAVLSQDIIEFVPYVFQVLAQLLYFRPRVAQGGLSDAYKALFPPLLAPVLWERKGNIPALIELLRAYVYRGVSDIVAGNHLTGVLGIFQKLLASKANESYGFSLLEALIRYVPWVNMDAYFRTILELLLRRLMENSTPHYMRHLMSAMCLMSTMYGAQQLYQTLEGIQLGMTSMLITKIWTPVSENSANIDTSMIKHMVIGCTKLLCDSPISQNPQLWGPLLKLTISIIDGNQDKSDEKDTNEDDKEDSREFDSTYSRLAYAQVPEPEPTQEMIQMTSVFVNSLATLCKSNPGAYSGLIQSVLDERGRMTLQTLLTQAGVTLV
eukprot:gene9929-20647_t